MLRFCGLVVMTEREEDDAVCAHLDMSSELARECIVAERKAKSAIVQARTWKSRYLAVCKAAGIDPKVEVPHGATVEGKEE